MSAEPDPTLQIEHIAELSRAVGEHEALRALREEARSLLDPLVLPSRARHLWKYTNPARFLPASDPTAPVPVAVPEQWRLDDPAAAAALVAAGQIRLVHLSEEARRAGVVVEDLHRGGAADLLGTAVPPTHGVVEAINAAAWRGGVLVRVPRGVTLEEPIRLRLLAGPGGAVAVPRVLVVAEPGSSFEVLEGHTAGETGSLVLGVSEIFVGEDASVRHALIQRWEAGVTGHLTARARVAANGRFQLAVASFGGSLYKADVGVVLAGEGAEAETFGVAMGGDRQHMDHHTEHIHLAGRTRSNLDVRVALTDAARSAYTGMIRIAAGARECEAYQENRNLLLSKEARAESIPELEILNQDVRCSHGATVAPLDPEQLFYLASRGLPHNHALRLIVFGFLDQTLARLPESSRQRLEALVAARLHTE